ncbi:MAG TPA: hypothetical protein VGJ16_08105 [Pirellulales bacterium]
MQRMGETLTDATEVIDGNQYSDCKFEGCQLIYRGGPLPIITNSQFNNCRWRFEDAAERTIIFMKNVYHGMGQGGAELIEATIKALREPPARPGT